MRQVYSGDARMKPVDRYILIGSRHDRLSEPMRMSVSEQWEEWAHRDYYCSYYPVNGQSCSMARKELQERPVPLEPTVLGDERGFYASLSTPVVHLFRDDAREFFGPYLPKSVVWGRVFRQEGLSRVPTRYSTCQVPRRDAVQLNRGTTPIAPVYCEKCGQAYCWAADCRHMGIMRWQIRDRPVLIDDCNMMAVHPEFFADMRLKERFPDLKVVHKIKVYDKDPHGWVLPGDPDWDGIFRIPPGWRPPPPPPSLEEFNRQFEKKYGKWNKETMEFEPPAKPKRKNSKRDQ